MAKKVVEKAKTVKKVAAKAPKKSTTKRVYKSRAKKVIATGVEKEDITKEQINALLADRDKYKKEVELLADKSRGSWLQRTVYTVDQGMIVTGYGTYPSRATLVLCGMITGCGAVQIHGISTITKAGIKPAKEVFKKIKADLKAGIGFVKAGCIIATLGQNYFHVEPIIKKLGFKEVCEYNNLQHGKGYKQKLFTLTF